MKRVIHVLSLLVPLATACLITGCEPSPPSEEELGQMVFSESEVPGANDTYVLPERLRTLQTNEKTEQQPPPGK